MRRRGAGESQAGFRVAGATARASPPQIDADRGSPEKMAQAQARGGPPDEEFGGGEKLSFVLASASGIFARGQARETFRDKPPRGRQGS
jgi:hypothetical protein